jgi:membrane-associated phospholipid phosphatase
MVSFSRIGPPMERLEEFLPSRSVRPNRLCLHGVWHGHDRHGSFASTDPDVAPTRVAAKHPDAEGVQQRPLFGLGAMTPSPRRSCRLARCRNRGTEPEHEHLVGRRSLFSVPRTKLRVVALVCLCTSALLALAVAHTSAPYAFENPALEWLVRPSAIRVCADLAELLAAPAVCAVLVFSFVFGCVKRAYFRVVVYAAFAAAAFLISEHIAKPLVQRMYVGEPSFPSGNVTAVSATALAMWLALYPLIGTWARNILFVLGAVWILLMSLAVVGAVWHTPLDDVGSVLLSIGIVTAGAAVFEPAAARTHSLRTERARIGGRR